jgi:hypothetical protein
MDLNLNLVPLGHASPRSRQAGGRRTVGVAPVRVNVVLGPSGLRG